MSFINQGKAGFIIGNVFKRSAMKGRNAFMDRRFTKQSGNPPQPPYPADQVWLAASYDRLTFELKQEAIGVGGHFCTHTADIYSPDYLGVYHKFGINEPVWEGHRRVENVCLRTDNILSPDWVKTNITATGGQVDPEGGTTAFRLLGLAAGSSANYMRRLYGIGIVNGETILGSWYVRRVTGSAPVRIYNGVAVVELIGVTTEWQRFMDITVAPGALGTPGFIFDGQGDEFDVWHPQYEVGVPVVGEYVENPGPNSTSVQKSFANSNGNTVLDNVVTEAVGPVLNPLPRLKYQKAATNYAQSFMSDDTSFWGNSASIPITDLGPSDVFPTQNKFKHSPVAVGDIRTNLNAATGSSGTDCIVYVLQAESAGRSRLRLRDQTAGVDVGDIQVDLVTGQLSSDLVPCDFISKEVQPGIWMFVIGSDAVVQGNAMRAYLYPSSVIHASTIVHYIGVITDSSVKEVLELGFIHNAAGGPGNGVATDETIYNWAAANHDDIGNSYEGDFFLSGEDQVLLSMGGVPVLSITAGGDVELTDGTLACYIPVVSAEPHIKASYGVDGMTLDVDGVTASCPYDGSLGAGVLSTECTSRRLLRIGS